MTHTRPSDFSTSFRDPSGFFWINKEGRALRYVFPEYQSEYLSLLEKKQIQEWINSKKLIETKALGFEEKVNILEKSNLSKTIKNPSEGILLEHKKILFPSYPYEWSPLMLYETALLTLELAETSLNFGYSLKDASPYNILFDGNTPCFVDFLSFEKRNPLDGTWKPYAQFLRNFILPLLANKHLGTPLKEMFLSSRDGITTERIYNQLGPIKRLSWPFFSLVSLPRWLGKLNSKNISYHTKLFSSSDQANFVLKTLFKHLRKNLNKLKPKTYNSTWIKYSECSHCSPEYLSIKENWVKDFIQEHSPHDVLDVGSNLGHYSKIFSSQANSVVSIDIDSSVIDSFWQQNKQEDTNIHTLLLDLAWPSPALGWEYRLTQSFLDRASGYFDTVLMYAIMHHFMITHQIPLQLIVSLATRLTKDWLIIEYVGFKDPMFKKLLRGRDALYDFFNEEYFEKSFMTHFEIINKLHIPSMERILYVMKKR